MAYDLFFLSHDEPMADLHWQWLHRTQPHAKRVTGIAGILAAHHHCALLARTSNFFVIDADNEIIDMDFSIRIPDHDKQYVHIWRARNPVNDLIYGWGGIKLFPKKLLLQRSQMPLDMSTSYPLKIMPQLASITHFNTSAFSTWRSAFRECVKLSRNDTAEAQERLAVWCSVAHGPFAEWCLHGARAGRNFGLANVDLLRINDWSWLQQQFEAIHVHQ